MSLEATRKALRKDYQTYYGWLMLQLRVEVTELPVPVTRIQASTDQHLNDIRLSKWDACDQFLQPRARALGFPWSLSDTVCTMKEAARRFAAQAEAK